MKQVMTGVVIMMVLSLSSAGLSQAPPQPVDKTKPTVPAAENKVPPPPASGDAFPVIFEAVQKATLSAERSGVITRLEADTGNHLKKGALIASIDTGELELRKRRNLQHIKYLDVQVNDLSKLSQRGLATNESVAKASMERDVTNTDTEIIKKQIADSFIHAPFDCVVIKRLVQPHEWVMEGKPVVEVLNPSKLRAVSNLPSHIAVTLDRKAKQTFYVNGLNITVTGTISAVAPEVDELSNTAKVIWDVENAPHELLPGMKGEVRIGK